MFVGIHIFLCNSMFLLVVGSKRRGAVNAKQLSYLAKYRPKSRLKMKHTCTIM